MFFISDETKMANKSIINQSFTNGQFKNVWKTSFQAILSFFWAKIGKREFPKSVELGHFFTITKIQKYNWEQKRTNEQVLEKHRHYLM